MINKINNLYNLFLDYLILKSLKKRFKNYVKSYPIVSGRLFDVQSLNIMLKGRFENNELITLKKNIFNKIKSKQNNALDIGANIGNHTNFFSENFSKVYAFEPLKENFELLELNTKLKKNIEIFKYGASSKNQKATLYTLSNTDTGHSSLMYSENSNITFDNKETIDLVNLDEFLNIKKINNIKFIKIDVEGYENEVLKGMDILIKKNKPIIALEQLAKNFKNSSTESINFLKKNNYNFFYEPDFEKRKEYRSKSYRYLLDLMYIFKLVFIRNFNKRHNIKKINEFKVMDYSMIIASQFDLES